jgi:GNAT superfamily N-acetyltransferase
MEEIVFMTHHCVTMQEMEATKEEMWVLVEGLGKNITQNLGNVELGKTVRIFAHDAQNKVVGGIAADIFDQWAYISLLWVDEAQRNHGIGTKLIKIVEKEAIRMGCKFAHVDTYSFEAKPLYERLEYEVFAVLEDYPKGHSKYFLKKRLVN